jgi:hypothetical protein
MYQIAQTVYLDPAMFNGAATVMLSSIDLYFASKPAATNNSSGITNPGVVIQICETVGGVPDISKIIVQSVARREFSEIFAMSDATVATRFAFPSFVHLTTGKTYAILFNPDDNGYTLWKAVTGQTILGTATVYPGGSLSFQGHHYSFATDGNWTPNPDTTLKFHVQFAQFLANSATVVLNNRNFEFLTVNAQSNTFISKEMVFKDLSVAAGTIVVSNTTTAVSVNAGATFNGIAVGSWMVIVSGARKCPRQIIGIGSNTTLTLDRLPSGVTNDHAQYFISPVANVYYQDMTANTIFLIDSTVDANTAFAVADTIRGEISNTTAVLTNVYNFGINEVMPDIFFGSTLNAISNMAILVVNSSYVSDATRQLPAADGVVTRFTYDAICASRSLEVAHANTLANGKSIQITVGLTTPSSNVNLFESPYLFAEKLDLFATQYRIGNTANNENTRYGDANAVHITQKFYLDNGNLAEDIVVFADVYKPPGSSVLVYTKIHNPNDPEAFEDKDWSLLAPVNNSDLQVSTVTNINDFKELQFGFPIFQASNTKTGTVTLANNSSTISGSNTTFNTDFVSGDVIKITNPSFPNNYFISVVNTVTNSTSLTVSDVTTNNSILGSGFSIDKVTVPHSAFIYGQNANVVQYYSNSLVLYKAYDTYQVKVVMLSNSSYSIPRLKSLRGIAVSA